MVPLASTRPPQSSRARAADAAANAASPDVSQPMPANRHDPMTRVLSASSSARSASSPTRTGSDDGRGLSRDRTWSRRACRSRPRVVEYRRDFDAKWPRKPSMSAHRPHPLYGPSAPVRPAKPARRAIFPTSFFRCRRCGFGVPSVADVGGGFGGVLRDIRGHGLRVQLRAGRVLPVRLPVHRSGVDLTAEPQQPDHIRPVDGRRLVRHLRGGGGDQVDQDVGVQLDGRRRKRIAGCRWAVEADQGVEVDDAASLELGDLRELHPHQLPTRRTPTVRDGGRGRVAG